MIAELNWDPAEKAHITNYLHIFATRNVLEILRQRDLDKQISVPGEPAWLAA